MRVLSIPGRTHPNRYFGILINELEINGIMVVQPTIRNVLSFNYDIVHINFPTHYITESSFFGACCFSVLLGTYFAIVRLSRRKIVYTVHDTTPLRDRHPSLSKIFLRLTHMLTSAFVFLSASSRNIFVRHYPRDATKHWILALHGPYPTTYLTKDERVRRRRKLEIDTESYVVGFLGNIKPYKNIEAILNLPDRLADGRKLRILVGGKAEFDHESTVNAVINELPSGQVIRLDQHLSDSELDELIQLVDIVLLPYTKGSNSGIALLVLSNRTQLIGSNLDIFRELSETVGLPWVMTYGEKSLPISSLSDVVSWSATQEISDRDRIKLDCYLDRIGFSNAAQLIAALYREL